MTPRLGPGRVIAIWSAGAADRQALADALANRFLQRGVPAIAMAAATGASLCAPGSETEEALALSHDFRLRIDEGCRSALVVADRSPLALLAEAGLAVQGWPTALISAEHGHAFTLLLPPDAPQPETQALDDRLRAAFSAVDLPCAIIHGRDPTQRLARAWATLQSGLDAREGGPQARLRSSAWNCERCSDPDCEHRLFTDLLAGRQTPATG